MNRLRSHFCKIFLLVLFLGYYGGSFLFPHVHHINGVSVVHSHPYAPKDATGSPHQHSTVEFQTIQHISLGLLAILALFVWVLYRGSGEAIRLVSPFRPRFTHARQVLARGPPADLFF